MAQGRKRQTRQQKRDITHIFVADPTQPSPQNDNRQTPLSGLNFRTQKRVKQRQTDLEWQIRFAKMKLYHWRELDNWNWEPLTGLLKRAEIERMQFG